MSFIEREEHRRSQFCGMLHLVPHHCRTFAQHADELAGGVLHVGIPEQVDAALHAVSAGVGILDVRNIDWYIGNGCHASGRRLVQHLARPLRQSGGHLTRGYLSFFIAVIAPCWHALTHFLQPMQASGWILPNLTPQAS